MRMVDIIEKKKDGQTLTKDEISFFVNGFVAGNIPEYQISSLLMAIIFKGMDDNETFNLTEAMLNSGDTVDLSGIKGIKCDKHSTGGVGDKVSLVLGPMVASCGIKLAKMSGRGLGHTGGTLDKLESIPGMKTRIDIKSFIDQVQKIGIAIIGQTDNLDPADKKLYALRDVTATVDSKALIASSIMSKKIASGADTILLDVKFGEGAFMKTIAQAKELAELMVKIGKHFGKDTRAEISDMNEPLGFAVGNILEVKEAIEALHGKGPTDLKNICLESGSTMLVQAKVVDSPEAAKAMLMSKIISGEAFEKLRQMVIAQGGDVSYIDHPEKFPVAMYSNEIRASASGYISRIDAMDIGLDAMRLGAGRETENDKIDTAAGIVLAKKVGDKVNIGDILATLYTEKPKFDTIAKDIAGSFILSSSPVQVHPIIWDKVE